MCKVLKSCSEFGGACPRIQSWALGCLANLLVCRENRRRLLGPALERRGGAAGGRGAAEGETTPVGERDSNKGREEEEEEKQQPEAKARQQQEEAKADRPREEEGGLEGPGRGEAPAAHGGGGGDCTSSDSAGLAGWIHTVLANSDRVASDRDAQYSGIACVREVAAAGPVSVRVMRSTGVPELIGAALERFGGTDPQLRDQANTALRCLSRGG